ncbi:BTAD domain-containing putative transcriptional regulator [Amycolatopsis sp. NPDC059657]|uniref:AfsR/SARP family transcriptional regulator n=1 Tax=Amycolatopsis sp. NPDC059657 TaxID=3346899 RepID=UPI00366F5CAE
MEAVVDGAALDLGRRIERIILGLLLVNLGSALSAERLIDLVWGTHLPNHPRRAVQVAVSRLRALLSAAGAERHGFRLTSSGGGYLVEGDLGLVDLHRFTALHRKAISVSAPEERSELLTEALGLWRGPVLGDIASATIRDRMWPGFDEQMLAATELRIDSDLRLGDHVPLVAELAALLREHPLRERLVCQSMVALLRSGRQAEALAEARVFRARLAEEHGLDPGPELIETERVVLLTDRAPLALGTRPVPALLPPAAPDFTGRAAELVQLTTTLTSRREALPVCVVSGTGGVGKSTLAIRAAHTVATAFPDGQLYADLRGVTTCPATPGEILGRFLRALDQDVPESSSEREDLYRSVLAGRRVLVVLDDARDEAQIRPLLPGHAECAVLVTSRGLLADLPGARRVDLGIFDEDNALELLTKLIGTRRVTADAGSASRLIALCGGLPLAVRTAGARLNARREWSLEVLVDRLADERCRLDELASGDLEVRANVGLSYRVLDPLTQRAFRLLGLLGIPDFAPWIVAALLDTEIAAAEDVVDRLVDARLADLAATGRDGRPRYRIHDLHRVFAAERAEHEESEPERAAAIRRALGAWLWISGRLAASTPSGEIDPCATDTSSHPIDYLPADGAAWFDAELSSLVVAVERAAAMDLDVVASEVSAGLCATSLGIGNRFEEWWRTHDAAIAAARRAGNTRCEAMLLAGLGQLRYAQDRFDAAHEFFASALLLFDASGDQRGRAVVLAGMGSAYREQGRFLAARDTLGQALLDFRAIGDEAGIGYTSRLAASVELEVGDFHPALTVAHEAIRAYKRLGSRRGEALALRTTSLIHRAMAEYAHAADLSARALHMLEELDDRLMFAYALQSLVKAEIRLGATVVPSLDDALATCRAHQDRLGEGLILRTMGEHALATGDLTGAQARLCQAIGIWESVDLPVFRARALRDLADVHTAAGRPDQAARARDQAIAIFAEFGAREHAELAGHLSARS